MWFLLWFDNGFTVFYKHFTMVPPGTWISGNHTRANQCKAMETIPMLNQCIPIVFQRFWDSDPHRGQPRRPESMIPYDISMILHFLMHHKGIENYSILAKYYAKSKWSSESWKCRCYQSHSVLHWFCCFSDGQGTRIGWSLDGRREAPTS